MNFDYFRSAYESLDDASPVSRRAALGRAGRLGAGAALAVTPFFAMAKQAHAAKVGTAAFSASAQPVDVLNFALTLEYLEYFYYLIGVRDGDIPSGDRPLFATIRDHELAHVDLLRGVIPTLGGTPVVFQEGDFDFTGAGFNPFANGNYGLFLALSQGFEDTGVRAYKGQAGNLVGGGDLLEVALKIHSVEARHAAAVRRLRGKPGYITRAQTDVPQLQAVYAGEDNVTQGGVDLAAALSGYTRDQITEAFDEPFTMAEVNAIAALFIR